MLLERLLQFKFEGQAATLMATLAETLERASRYSTELQRATLATRMQARRPAVPEISARCANWPRTRARMSS